ncbi:DUF4365 domain-containing protein [Nocardia sp. NPDC019395]|uniref:DUF4365 domain-containing protein n=1 Tax=Nocardia sp. NPDC019395 TaxID=3154686 RepID=UPI0033E16DA9
MSPERPPAHIKSDRSVAKLIDLFSEYGGWTAEELKKDYGEDLLVRIFESNRTTPYAFFVQLKHFSNRSRHLSKDGKYLKYSFDVRHVAQWNDLWEPVVLVLWDSELNEFYWEIAQSPEIAPSSRGKKSRTIYIPIDNRIDKTGIARIAVRTRKRHERFENEQTGATALIGRLSELVDFEIDYHPQAGLLFLTWPDGRSEMTAFGKGLEKLLILSAETGLEIDSIPGAAVNAYSKVLNAFSAGAIVGLVDSKGKAVNEWESLDEFMRFVDRNREFDEIRGL